jgi:NAD(P)-dependent dehydrogenase (short-subunit alcohol dehydrogenase family)
MARGHGGRAIALPCDVSDMTQVAAAVAEVEREWGGLDVVVVNAAAPMFGRFTDVSVEDFDRSVNVTFLGAVNTIRATLPLLERTHGTIVATGSLMAQVPLPTFASYAASKHALRGFMGSLRVELRSQRSPVRLAMLHPGSIDTPFWKHATSASGKLPRHPPEGYKPSVIADGLVALARDPRPEVTIGLEGKLIELLWRVFPAAGDVMLLAVDRYYMSGRKQAPALNMLWEGRGDGQEESGPMVSRPSLWAPIRWRLRAPVRLRR